MQQQEKATDYLSSNAKDINHFFNDIENSNDVDQQQKIFMMVKDSLAKNFLSLTSATKHPEHLHELKELIQRLNLIDPESAEWLKVYKEFKNYYLTHFRNDF